MLSDIYLLKKGNVKQVKGSFKSVKLCKFVAWCPDVLADKPHPRFDTKNLSKKVWLIRRCLRYFKNYYESGIIYVNDLLFKISTNDSFDYFANQISKINFLQWAGLVTFYTRLFKRRLHIPAINLSFISDSQQHL